ncbi:regulatory protein RecX [Kitasatospora sp. NPDC086801]|uniref:regulatory protein RecX n=1 Tax=Kitasatospora sp. NPDC086801 TaxID=3364066 RepID=UPI0037F1F2E4
MTQHDAVGDGGPAGPDGDDYGPPDWFAAVAAEPEPSYEAAPRARSQSRKERRRERSSAAQWASGSEPEFDRAPARAVRGAAPGPAPAEPTVGELGLVSASELPTGRRRRRSAVAAEEFDETGSAAAGDGWSGAGAVGHGGVTAPAQRPGAGARRGRRAAAGRSAGPASDEAGAPGEEHDPSARTSQNSRTSRSTRTAGTARKRAGAEEAADPETRARDICLRLLTGAAKSRKQLADALRKREIPDDVADEVLTRLEEAGLIDDAAFAAAWVESRHAVRGLSRRALAQELRTKGVAADLVEQAVAQLDHDDETEAARALVDRKLRATRGLDPQVRTRRLVGVLARRGYSEGLAFRVVRSALEEEETGEASGTGRD